MWEPQAQDLGWAIPKALKIVDTALPYGNLHQMDYISLAHSVSFKWIGPLLYSLYYIQCDCTD